VPLVAPSILSADFGRLTDEVAAVTVAGADWIHVDIMDGHFVPPITIGPMVTGAVRRATSLPLDVHLMIEHPERQIPEFVKAGASRITVHVEACPDVPAVLKVIRDAGAAAQLSLNPPTPIERIRPFVHLIDLLLVMTVNPGWGGQPFVEGSMERIAAARAIRSETGTKFLIEVDGGIYPPMCWSPARRCSRTPTTPPPSAASAARRRRPRRRSPVEAGGTDRPPKVGPPPLNRPYAADQLPRPAGVDPPTVTWSLMLS
jgi:ribulose-phosphate 3-epimerase